LALTWSSIVVQSIGDVTLSGLATVNEMALIGYIAIIWLV